MNFALSKLQLSGWTKGFPEIGNFAFEKGKRRPNEMGFGWLKVRDTGYGVPDGFCRMRFLGGFKEFRQCLPEKIP